MTLQNIKNNERGFTIVELLIVIIVIGILAALVLIGYSNVQTQARDTSRQANAGSLRDAIAAFKTTSTTSVYPQITNSGFTSDINGNSNVNLDQTLLTKVNVGYSGSTNAPTGGASSSAKDNYLVQYCPSASTTTSSSATGVAITYWSDTKSGGAGTLVVSTGTGC